MTDLRNPALRHRDVDRVTRQRLCDVHWEPGFENENEWVYASVESKKHRDRLLAWLRSKKIPAGADAFLFWAGESRLVTVSWREVLEAPERFFADRNFRIVSKDVEWALDYQKEFVARFGRRDLKKEANKAPEPTPGTVTPRASSPTSK